MWGDELAFLLSREAKLEAQYSILTSTMLLQTLPSIRLDFQYLLACCARPYSSATHTPLSLSPSLPSHANLPLRYAALRHATPRTRRLLTGRARLV